MEIIELDAKYFANLGKTPPYRATEIVGKEYQEEYEVDFLIPGEEKSFLILNKEKAWIVHSDSLVSVVNKLESYLGLSVDDFIMISLGTEYHKRFCFNDNYEIWEKMFKKLRTAYYFPYDESYEKLFKP